MNMQTLSVFNHMNTQALKTFKRMLAILVIFVAAPASCWARCTSYPMQPNYNVSFGTVNVPASLPVGGVIATQRTAPGGNYATWTCLVGTRRSGVLNLFGTPTGLPNVYATNIAGVGIRISLGELDVFGQPDTSFLPFTGNANTAPNLTYGAWFYVVDLIKTGSIVAGRLTTGVAATAGNDGIAMNVLVLGATSIVPAAPTCSLSTSNATFNMGTVPVSAFTGVGTIQEWVANQSLVSGGCNASTVSMTFAGTAAPAPYSNAFANSGTAQGVGLELWQAVGAQAIPNGRPITFAAQGAGGLYTFQARYIQTAPTVVGGSVSATVTVTLNYQ